MRDLIKFFTLMNGLYDLYPFHLRRTMSFYCKRSGRLFFCEWTIHFLLLT